MLKLLNEKQTSSNAKQANKLPLSQYKKKKKRYKKYINGQKTNKHTPRVSYVNSRTKENLQRNERKSNF